MKRNQVVVLYGSSLLISGLETCLNASSQIDLIRIQPDQPNPVQRVSSSHPDVIIFDSGDRHLATLPGTAQLTREVPGALIIELDAATNSVTLLSSEQRKVTKSEDILEAIQRAGVLITRASP